MKTKRLPKVGTRPKEQRRQIAENFTGYDIFRGEHPGSDIPNEKRISK